MIKKIIRNPFLWAFFIGIASLHLIKNLALWRRTAPEPLVVVPDWNLIDENGQAFGKKDLAGKLIIANFFFTSCPSICPKLTEAMKEVYERFKDKAEQVHFVGFTIDPEVDKPELLKKFKSDQQLDFANWHLLTGSKKEVYDVVMEKMKIHVGDRQALATNGDAYDIPHLGQLALFDQNGDLRGLFNTDNLELATLVRSANFLLEQ